MKARKIIIAVAPVAHVGSSIPSGAKNPLSPEEVAQDVLNCARAGASVVHLHVRDSKGNQVANLKNYVKTLDLIRAESDIIIQGSTGGVSTLSLEDRCVSVAEPRSQMGSLNMGSTNFGETVYVNSLSDIRFWAEKMAQNRVVPELVIFDLGMLGTAEKLWAEGVLKKPLSYTLVLGVEGAFEASAENIFYFRDSLPAGAVWGVIHDNMKDMSLLAAALGFGAGAVRVGFEDSFFYAPGKVAESNAELVERLAALVRHMGFEPATVKEAKKILKILK